MRARLCVFAALLALALASSVEAAYPGKNGKIAFVRAGAIYTIGSNGAGLRRLVVGENPAWSPDGRRVAFDRKDRGVFVMDADGKNIKQLTREGENDPTWTPDGERLVFVASTPPPGADCSPTGEYDVLWSIGADGTGKKPFTPASVADEICSVPGGDTAPAFSPRGDRVAFLHSEYIVHEDYGTAIAFASADGKKLKPLFAGGGAPNWSPDGTEIVWPGLYKKHFELYAGNPDTGKTRRLTKSAAENLEPAWSPDGNKLVFSRWKGKLLHGLFVLDVKRGTLQQLTKSPTDSSPDWQPRPS